MFINILLQYVNSVNRLETVLPPYETFLVEETDHIILQILLMEIIGIRKVMSIIIIYK
jgi:hypothetical protein